MTAASMEEARILQPGRYYTDGRRLLRIVSEEAHGELRSVEDCRTLDMILLAVDELAALGVRPVATESPQPDGPIPVAIPR